MWTIRVKCYNGVTYNSGSFRSKKAAVCKLFDGFLDFPKQLWNVIGTNRIVNHTCSGDNVYSVVQI